MKHSKDCACEAHAIPNDDSRIKGPDQERRGFLGATLAAALGSTTIWATTADGNELPPESGKVADMSPSQALNEVMAGNARFASGKPTAHLRDLAIIKARAAEGQWPAVGVLACADSRVPVEMVFDEYIGRLFVTRVAGNVTTPEIIASLEYGVAVLGLKAIIVLGHSQCGAVSAALDNPEVPGQISALFPAILPAIYLSKSSDPLVVTRTNAVIHASMLAHASPVIAEKVKSGHLKVVAGIYDVATGKVELIPITEQIRAGHPNSYSDST